MNTSGDAAEQVVRLSLEGMEVAAKITGSAAKEVAALLYAALKNRDKNKIKGRQRLTSMLRSGKELTIFTVKNKDMARFVAEVPERTKRAITVKTGWESQAVSLHSRSKRQ